MHKPATNVGLRDGVERLVDRLDQRLDCLGFGAARIGQMAQQTLQSPSHRHEGAARVMAGLKHSKIST